MMFTRGMVLVALLPAAGSAQSLASRIAGMRDGTASFTFSSRPGVCGDGREFLRDGLGDGYLRSANFEGYVRDGQRDDECEPGPVRVVTTVAAGEVVRVRTHAGPAARESDGTRQLGAVSVRDAVEYLMELTDKGTGKVASDALLPLVLADTTPPWGAFLRIARSEERPRSLRQSASTWLGRAAAAKLGVAGRDETDEDAVRASAVFALYQQSREHAIADLLGVARSSPHTAARSQALFWLGQSGDPRALQYLGEFLGVK